MAVRLIAFDMDDTLLRDDRTIGARTLRALRAAHESGVRIVPATGRGIIFSFLCANAHMRQ